MGNDTPVSADSGKPTFIGSYLHVDNEQGFFQKQGQVIARVEPGLYLVEWFEWLWGQANGRSLVRVEDMMDWRFYPTADEMREYYEGHPRKQSQL